jgi:hypothetical protein
VNGSAALFVAVAIVLPLALAEFGDWSPWLAECLVRWAARRLPDPAARSRYEEEWAANLRQVPGKFAPLLTAVGYLTCLPAMWCSTRRRPTQPALPAPADLSAAHRRAVFYLVRDAGIRQFLDIQAGAPSAVRTHELAWTTCPESRIFYAADTPARLPPALPQAYLDGSAIDHVTADPRDPAMILRASIETLDYSQPIAVLLRGLLGHVGDQEEAQAIAGCLMQAMPSGSYLVLIDSADFAHDDQSGSRASADTGAARPPALISRILDSLEVVSPSQITADRDWPRVNDPAATHRTSCVMVRKP